MSRTRESIVKRYNEGSWIPTHQSEITSGNTEENWSRLLHESVASIGASGSVTISYVLLTAADDLLGGGYVFLDYTQTSILGVKPVSTLVHQVTDGEGSLTQWVLDYKLLSSNVNKLDLRFNLKRAGLYIKFSVDGLQNGSVITSPAFAIWKIPSNALIETLHGNRFFEMNDNGDIYNTNLKGRIGVNTGTEVRSDVILDVNGNIALNGDIRLKKSDSDEIIIDSRTDLGYFFGIREADGSVPIFYIDDVKQFGFGTNIPKNKIHVVGNAQITERTSIGAGNTPDAKLHIVGEGDTYDTMSIYAVNSIGEDLIRVHDDGTVWISEISHGVVLSPLHFGNGLSGNDYDGSAEITVSIGNLIGTPTGTVYTP